MSLPLAFPKSVPTLSDARVCLRELCVDDIPAWFARATDAESADLAGDPVPESVEQGVSWLQRHREHLLNRRGIRWAIVLPDETPSVGTVGLGLLPGLASADLGVVVGRSHWGRGVGTAAARLVCDYAFRVLGIEEVRAEVLQRNHASIRLLEKVGFTRLREVKGTFVAGGDAEDCYLYSLHDRFTAVPNPESR